MRPPQSSDLKQPQKVLQGTIDYDVQAQAQEKVQEEACLTDSGILFMVERFTDPELARTYLSLKESVRIMFLKKQVAQEDSD
jgi:hypothetical protein